MNDEDARPVDIAAVIYQMRASGDVPADALAAIEQAHEIFKRHVALEPAIARQAFEFGKIIGAHVGSMDAVPIADRLLKKRRSSKGGRASGAVRKVKPWHEPAEELALGIRAKYPSWLKKTIIAEVFKQMKASGVECPRASTVGTFLRNIVKDNKRPK